jgi:predicted nucleic acid-binding Zn ribbon protein
MSPTSTSPTSTSPAGPSRDDNGTIRPVRSCAGCGQGFMPTGRQRHCSSACRKRVFRTRRRVRAADQAADPELVLAGRARREHTVYECPDCGTRQLGVQRCAECGRFARAAGLGGACPGCGDPVTLADLDLVPHPAPGVELDAGARARGAR